MAFVTAQRSRPHPLFIENGDCVGVRERAGDTLLMLVDGVGHGLHAARAAQAAFACFHQSDAPDLRELLAGCNAALADTRGAALALVQLRHDETTLAHLGIGNVAAYLWTPDGSQTLINHNGIAGRLRHFPAPLRYPTVDRHLLVLHSDGIPRRQVQPLMATWDGNLEALADRFIEAAVERDDASVLLAQVRHAQPALRWGAARPRA